MEASKRSQLNQVIDRSVGKCKCGRLVVALWSAGALVWLAGCNGSPSADLLNAQSAEAAEADPHAAERAAAEKRLKIPPRINRDFFERNLIGKVQVPEYSEDQSSVEWAELPTTLPEPEPGYIADFRDHPGCARFVQAGGMELCFNIVPDVSSVDLTAEALTLNNAKQYVEQALGARYGADCTGVVQGLSFVQAERSEDEVRVRFNAERSSLAAERGCGEAGPIALELTLQAA